MAEEEITAKPNVGETTETPAKKAKAAEKPVVAKPASGSGSRVRFVIVTKGQGGFNIGHVLASVLPNKPKIIAVNSSNEDLKNTGLPDEWTFKIGGVNADGAGKERSTAKTYYKSYKAVNKATGEELNALSHLIAMYEEVFFHPTDQTIIICTFSSDGGTGSGIGPMLTATLTNYMNTCTEFKWGGKSYTISSDTNDVPRPVVIGLTTKCSVKSGSKNLQNTIECFLDIQKFIDKGIGNFFIADNNLEGVEFNGDDEMYRIINARIAAPFVKFFGVEMNSDIKCMDLQDKINSLRIPGCSAFASATKDNMFQYVIPRGQSTTRTVMMIRHDEENPGEEEQYVKDCLRKLDVVSFDTTSVFFQIEKSGISTDSVSKDLITSSMIGFFGFHSLNAIVEDLRDNLHRLQVATSQRQDVIKNNSTGFTSVAEDAAEMSSRFGPKSMDQDSLMDLV